VKISHKTRSDKSLKILQKAQLKGFSFFDGSSGIMKTLRNIEKKANRQSDNLQVFYDPFKKKGVVFCKNKPDIKKNKIIFKI